MTKANQQPVRFVRWQGGQHPTPTLMKQNLEKFGLHVFKWQHQANYRFGTRSHGYSKSLYCVEGSIEVFVPDTRDRFVLKAGDRLDIAKGVRHSIAVGLQGAICFEGTPADRRLVAVAGKF